MSVIHWLVGLPVWQYVVILNLVVLLPLLWLAHDYGVKGRVMRVFVVSWLLAGGLTYALTTVALLPG